MARVGENAAGSMMKPTGTPERVFAAFVKPELFGNHSVYLVNNTPVHYARVVALTGMFASVDGGLVESTHARTERGALPPPSAILLEEAPAWELDFNIGYNLDLVPADPARPPKRVWFQFGRLHFARLGDPALLPVLDRDGWAIELTPREDSSEL